MIAPYHSRSMLMWKPHALAKPHEGQLDLRIGDRVQASVDLPGVAAGTKGKVILANGFNWQRYRVLFDRRHRARRPRPPQPRADRAGRPPAGQGGQGGPAIATTG